MQLSVRTIRLRFAPPNMSNWDLLGFFTMWVAVGNLGYTNIGKLAFDPPGAGVVRAVIHGVLEEAYRRYGGFSPGRKPQPATRFARGNPGRNFANGPKATGTAAHFPWGEDLEELGAKASQGGR